MTATAASPARTMRQPAGPAAFVDVRACARPRLRALAEVLAGRPVAIIGTGADAARAVDAGLSVLRSFQPPLGRVSLSGSALRRAGFGGRRFGAVMALGPRAEEAVRVLGMRPEAMPDALPSALRPVDPVALREAWGLRSGEAACLLIASPPAACDARVALDMAGRAAILGRPVVLVVHPDSANAAQAEQLARAAGGAWRIAFDERVEEPEWVAGAVDVAIAVDRRAPLGATELPTRGLAATFAAFVRGVRAPAVAGDPIAVRLAVRAGLPVVSCGTAGDEFVPGECRIDPRRPNAVARALFDKIKRG